MNKLCSDNVLVLLAIALLTLVAGVSWTMGYQYRAEEESERERADQQVLDEMFDRMLGDDEE